MIKSFEYLRRDIENHRLEKMRNELTALKREPRTNRRDTRIAQILLAIKYPDRYSA